jgi:hypothetical protein
MRARNSRGSRRTSKPSSVTVPASACSNPQTIRKAVDLPAPFGPTRPTTSPAAAESETPDEALLRPNDLWMSTASRSALAASFFRATVMRGRM